MTNSWNTWIGNFAVGQWMYVKFQTILNPIREDPSPLPPLTPPTLGAYKKEDDYILEAISASYVKIEYLDLLYRDSLNLNTVGGREYSDFSESQHKYYHNDANYGFIRLDGDRFFYVIANDYRAYIERGIGNQYGQNFYVRLPPGKYDLRFKHVRYYGSPTHIYYINGIQHIISLAGGGFRDLIIPDVEIHDDGSGYGKLDIIYRTKRWGGLDAIFIKELYNEAVTDWSLPIIVLCLPLGHYATDWSDEVTVVCTLEPGDYITDWSNEMHVVCTAPTDWSETITVTCRHINTKEMHKELISKHLGNSEHELDHYVNTAKNFALIRELSRRGV